MKIVVVSAHFPPNFVSGGTLQPQRLARGMRDRGHDVSVYAGWLGERPPLDSWDEVDETGMPIRWVSTGTWIGWADRKNWDNPQVTAHFSAYLRQRRPEVVHLHSLQSLGAGLVKAAAGAGAKVVVTMHDFWWSCARQFLVDRHMRPCSLVVAAGSCPCEVDPEWLRARNAGLAEALALVDLVLAPSAVVADALAANGVDPARLEVNENGMATVDRTEARPLPPADGAPVRFVYSGGGHPLKGVDVLFRAARRMAAVPGWRLDAYGAAVGRPAGADLFTGADGHHRLEGIPAVRILPPFDPADMEAVYADADVVVVPSVARESYSLVTREALVRGVPVICTDTLGPEEVVEDGRNGLVVEAGDHLALAAAMRQLVENPELLSQIRRGAEAPLATKTLEDQLDGLESAYHKLAVPAPTTPGHEGGRAEPSSQVRRVLFLCGIQGAPLRYRARLPAEALGLLGARADVRHYRHPDVSPLAARADAVVVYRVPATVQVLDLIERTRARGIPVFFDVDDLIFDPKVASEVPALRLLPEDEAALYMQGVHRYRTTMEACDAFIGSTTSLCRHATELTGMASHRFANGVGLLLGRLSDKALRRSRSGGPPRIGYLSGTNTHDLDWAFVEPAVLEILGRHAGVQLWLGGQVKASDALDRFGSRVRRLPMLHWTELPAVLADLDVNLAPLQPDSVFNDAKSAIKWLEAALTATATVASPTEPFCEAIEPGRTGLLADTAEQWVDSIETLLVDEDLRASIARRARRAALLGWSPFLQGRRYLSILEEGGVQQDQAARCHGWTSVALNEPPDRIELDPYGTAGASIATVSGGFDPSSTPLERGRAGITVLRRRANEVLSEARAVLAGRRL